MLEIACHKHGCCVVQKCLDASTQDQKYSLIDRIVELTHSFVKNPFANYVLQYVLEMRVHSKNELIASQLYGRILEFGKFKFSSNVIEKVLAPF